MASIHWLIMQYVCKYNGNPGSYYHVHRNRYYYFRMPKHCDSYRYSKSIARYIRRTWCNNMCRRCGYAHG
jgi:hypothetical protein